MAATNDMSVTLQKGLFEEEANHDLNAAIRAYQSVVAQFDKDRKLAATAVFRLGECYRKQGKTNEANAQYERVLKEFSDQATIVELCRGYLKKPEKPLANIAPQAEAVVRKSSPKIEIIIDSADATFTGEWTPASTPQNRNYKFSSTVTGNATATATFRPNLPQAGKYRVEVRHIQGPNHARDALWEIFSDAGQANVRVNQTMHGGTWFVIASEFFPAGTNSFVRLANSDRVSGAMVVADAVRFVLVAPYVSETTNSTTSTASTDDEEKEIRRIKALIKESPDLINARNTPLKAGDSATGTPLHKAAIDGQLAVAEFLLANGADVESKSSWESTPLMLAAQHGHKAMVELLLAKGAKVQSVNQSRDSALHLAIREGYRAVAETLLRQHANLEAKNNNNLTPLGEAIKAGHNSLAEFLIEKGAAVKGTSGYLFEAASYGNTAIMKLLIAKGADVNQQTDEGWTPLLSAVKAEQVEAAKVLLQNKADVNARLPAGASSGWTAMHLTIGRSNHPNPDMVSVLLQHGANLELKGRFPSSDEFFTPLHFAVRGKHREIAGLLLKQGANPNSTNEAGFTPLHLAVSASDKAMAELLLTHKAEINAQSVEGYSPLHWAAAYNKKEMAEWLLRNGAVVDAKTKLGDTALHISAKDGRIPLVELLLAHKANPNLVNNSGYNALDFAKHRMRQSVAPGTPEPRAQLLDLLQKHGASEFAQRNLYIYLQRNDVKRGFLKGNAINRYTLLDLIGQQFGLNPSEFQFPDFRRVKIKRWNSDVGQETEMPVDLEAIFQSGDCTKDIPLEWGDIVELPETDHRINEHWSGLSPSIHQMLQECLTKKVTIIIKGEATSLTLIPEFRELGGPGEPPPTLPAPASDPHSKRMARFWIKEVLSDSKLLRASSDLTRVRLKRIDPQTKQSSESIINLETETPEADAWLRDGDVIEVPEKP